jgi:hypothetical protein
MDQILSHYRMQDPNNAHYMLMLSWSIVAIHKATTPLSFTQLKDILSTCSGPINKLAEPSPC